MKDDLMETIDQLRKQMEKKDLQIKNLQEIIREILGGEITSIDQASRKRFEQQFGV